MKNSALYDKASYGIPGGESSLGTDAPTTYLKQPKARTRGREKLREIFL